MSLPFDALSSFELQVRVVLRRDWALFQPPERAVLRRFFLPAPPPPGLSPAATPAGTGYADADSSCGAVTHTAAKPLFLDTEAAVAKGEEEPEREEEAAADIAVRLFRRKGPWFRLRQSSSSGGGGDWSIGLPWRHYPGLNVEAAVSVLVSEGLLWDSNAVVSTSTGRNCGAAFRGGDCANAAAATQSRHSNGDLDNLQSDPQQLLELSSCVLTVEELRSLAREFGLATSTAASASSSAAGAAGAAVPAASLVGGVGGGGTAGQRRLDRGREQGALAGHAAADGDPQRPRPAPRPRQLVRLNAHPSAGTPCADCHTTRRFRVGADPGAAAARPTFFSALPFKLPDKVYVAAAYRGDQVLAMGAKAIFMPPCLCRMENH